MALVFSFKGYDIIFCKLFSNRVGVGSALSNKGLNDWKNISVILANHEKSNDLT